MVNGKLQVIAIAANAVAEAQHTLPVPNFYRLTLDVETDNFNGVFYGFEPFSNTQTFSIGTTGGTRKIDGLGAVVNDKGQVGFLGFDVDRQGFVIFNAADYGAVTSLGVEWASTGVTLFVNGTARQTIGASTFGVSALPTPSLDTLSLIATGTTSRVRFDNICQK